MTVTDNCDGTSTLSTAATGTLLWSTGEATPSISVNAPGAYTVTTTVNGCTSLPGSGTAAPKTTPAAPVVTVTDNCDGTSTLSTAATGTLLWSNGATTASTIVNTPGIYTVTTTVNGCTSPQGSGTAAPKTAPTTPIVTVTDNCNNTSTLSTAASGILLWSNGATTASTIVNTPGIYTVTTTVNGCTSQPGNGTAAPKTTPTTPIVTVTDNCNNSSTLSTSATGTLLWSNGASTASIVVNTPGTYTVTTTVNGCTSLPGSGTAAPKTTPATPVVTVVDNCNSTSTLSTAAAGTLLWSNGATTASTIVNTPGVYTVTTTINGCTSLPGSGTAAPKSTPVTPVVTVVDNCNNTSTLSTVATGTLLWSNGASTTSINVTTPGTYTVTTTVNGCTSLPGSGTAAPKTTPATPVVTVVDNCNSTSTLSTVATGTLLWSTGATTASTIVNTPGVYTVTTTINGCTSLPGSGTAAPKSIPVTPVVTVVDNCNNTSTLSTVATGTLLWSNGASTTSINVTTPGTYTVTTTVNGCTSLPGSGTAAPKTAPATPVVTVVDNCNSTSTLSTAATGTLLWNTGATTPSITVYAAGTYTVRTTVNGCTSQPGSGTAAPKTAPAAPVVTVTDNCNNSSTLSTSATGTLLWSNGASTTSINVTTPGTYTVTTTVNGCTSLPGSGTAAPKTTPATPVVTVVNNCNSTSTLSTTATGTLLWNTGATTTSITVYTAGTYTVRTTVNGCTSLPGSGTAAPKSTPVTPVITVVNNCNSTSTLSTVATGTLLWNTGATTPSITVNAAGTYTVRTTVNGCTSQPGSGTAAPKTTPATPVVTVVDNCNSTSTLSTAATGSLLWNTGATTPSITVYAAGTYTVRTTVNGCTSLSGSGTAAPKTAPSAPVPGNISQPTCTVSTGSVVLSGLPSTGIWTLARNPGSILTTGTGTNTAILFVPSGRYTFTVTNAAGCTSVASPEVVINSQPDTPVAPVVGAISQPGCSVATGSVTLNGLPGTGFWTLTRYPGTTTTNGFGTTTTIVGLVAGTYNYSVRNADGCTSVISANITITTQPPTPTAPVPGTIIHPTFAVPTGSVALSGLPSGNWTLTQNPGGIKIDGTGETRTVSGLEPGNYTFTVTNSFGCTSVSTDNILINARPGPPKVVVTDPATVCSTETADLTKPEITEGSDAGLIFTYWTDSLGTIAFDTPAAATAGTYYIKGTTTAGYYTIKPVNVTTDQMPVADAGPDQVLEYQFSTLLSAEPVEIGTGVWSLSSGTGKFSNAASAVTIVSGLSTGANRVSWTVTNGVCPAAIDYLTVTVKDLSIPTLITPDGDPYNEFFILQGLETLGKTELIIIDRRGVQVFKALNYKNDWNGLDSSGDPLPDDTYFYILKAANGKSLSGYIVIRR